MFKYIIEYYTVVKKLTTTPPINIILWNLKIHNVEQKK